MTTRAARGSLGRLEVLDAALALVDRVGVDDLTIRGLARALGRSPMSLYAHFTSKADLLDQMFERLLHRLFTTHAHAKWQSELESSCRHMRQVLREHPHWLALLTRVTVPLSALDVYDHMLELMHDDGVETEAAMFAFSSVVALAIGSVLVERMMDGSPSIPKQRLTLVRTQLANKPRRAHASIARTIPKFDAWTFDRVFDLSAHSLVAGLDECAPRRKTRSRSHAFK